MSDEFNLPDGANDLRGTMSGGVISLPYPHVFFRWHNGEQQFKELQDVRYYGGWVANADNMEDFVADTGTTVLGTKILMTSKSGSQYDAYLTRTLWLAPYARRERWRDGVSHVQIACCCAIRTGDKFEYWGDIVTTAKVYSALRISEAFSKWEKVTSQVRREHANGHPAWFWYAGIGTFGNEIKVEVVGQGVHTSPITPAQLYEPKEVNLDLMKKLFVGEEVAAVMLAHKDEAQEWVEAWAKGEEEETDEGSYSRYSDYGTPDEPMDDNDIPF